MNNNRDTRRDFIKNTSAVLAGLGMGSTWQTCGAASPAENDSGISPPGITGKLPQRILGRTRLPVSLLGMGVGPIINDAVYRRAFDLGVRYFHISFDKYSTVLPEGETFNKVALAALQPFRKEIVVSYMTMVRTTRKPLLEDLDAFLAESGFGHVDVWFVCCPSPDLINEFGEALAVARKMGKARWGALSTHGLKAIMPQLVTSDSPIDVVMMTYNHTSSEEDRQNLQSLHHAGLGITPMKPMAGRFAENAAADPGPPLRWLAADERVHTIPVSMDTIAKVEQNAAALQTPLSEQDRSVLQTQRSYASPRFCRMCGACDGKCPNHLAVSDLVRSAMYADGYADLRMARSQFAAIPDRQRRVACQDCIQCTVQCPNGVAIRDRIQKAQKLLS